MTALMGVCFHLNDIREGVFNAAEIKATGEECQQAQSAGQSDLPPGDGADGLAQDS